MFRASRNLSWGFVTISIFYCADSFKVLWSPPLYYYRYLKSRNLAFYTVRCSLIQINKYNTSKSSTKHFNHIAQLNCVTDSTKINRPGHSIRMYWTIFWQPTAHVHQNIFGKTPTKVCSPHLYPSFYTFYVKIGWLFKAQWVFEECLKIDNELSSKENVVDFRILPNV